MESERKLKIGFFGETDNFFRDDYMKSAYPFLREENQPYVDIWIAVGSLSAHGYSDEISSFFKYFLKLPSKYKIAVPGKRDKQLGDLTYSGNSQFREYLSNPNNHFLVENDCVIEGLRIYGTPFSLFRPDLNDNYFDKYYLKNSQQELSESWNLIPYDTSILITGVPPYSILDKYKDPHYGIPHSVGDEDLLYRVQTLEKLSIHAFCFKQNLGIKEINGTTFINCLVKNNEYVPPVPFKILDIKY